MMRVPLRETETVIRGERRDARTVTSGPHRREGRGRSQGDVTTGDGEEGVDREGVETGETIEKVRQYG